MQPSFLPTYCNLSMPKPTCTLQLHINITVGYGVFNFAKFEYHNQTIITRSWLETALKY